MAAGSITGWTARDQVQISNYPTWKQQVTSAIRLEQQERLLSIVRDSFRETTDIEKVSWLPEYFGGDLEPKIIAEKDWNSSHVNYRTKIDENGDSVPLLEWEDGLTELQAKTAADSFDNIGYWDDIAARSGKWGNTVRWGTRIGTMIVGDETNWLTLGGALIYKGVAKGGQLLYKGSKIVKPPKGTFAQKLKNGRQYLDNQRVQRLLSEKNKLGLLPGKDKPWRRAMAIGGYYGLGYGGLYTANLNNAREYRGLDEATDLELLTIAATAAIAPVAVGAGVATLARVAAKSNNTLLKFVGSYETKTKIKMEEMLQETIKRHNKRVKEGQDASNKVEKNLNENQKSQLNKIVDEELQPDLHGGNGVIITPKTIGPDGIKFGEDLNKKSRQTKINPTGNKGDVINLTVDANGQLTLWLKNIDLLHQVFNKNKGFVKNIVKNFEGVKIKIKYKDRDGKILLDGGIANTGVVISKEQFITGQYKDQLPDLLPISAKADRIVLGRLLDGKVKKESYRVVTIDGEQYAVSMRENGNRVYLLNKKGSKYDNILVSLDSMKGKMALLKARFPEKNFSKEQLQDINNVQKYAQDEDAQQVTGDIFDESDLIEKLDFDEKQTTFKLSDPNNVMKDVIKDVIGTGKVSVQMQKSWNDILKKLRSDKLKIGTITEDFKWDDELLDIYLKNYDSDMNFVTFKNNIVEEGSVRMYVKKGRLYMGTTVKGNKIIQSKDDIDITTAFLEYGKFANEMETLTKAKVTFDEFSKCVWHTTTKGVL